MSNKPEEKETNSTGSLKEGFTDNGGVEVQDAKNLLAVNFIFLNALNQASLSFSGINLGSFSEATVWLSILTLGLDLGDNFDLALEVVIITTAFLLWFHYSFLLNSVSLRRSKLFSSVKVFSTISILILSLTLGFFTATIRDKDTLDVKTFIILGSVLSACAGYYIVYFGFKLMSKQFAHYEAYRRLLALEAWILEVAMLLLLPTLAGIAAGYFVEEDYRGTEIIALVLSGFYSLIVLVLSFSLTIKLTKDIQLKPFFWGFFLQPDKETLFWFVYRGIFLEPIFSQAVSRMAYSPSQWPYKDWTFFIIPLLMVEKIIIAASSRFFEEEEDEITLLAISAGVYSAMLIPFLFCRFTSQSQRNEFDYNLELGVRFSTVVAISLAIGSKETEYSGLQTGLEYTIGGIYILLAVFWLYLIKAYGIFSQVYNTVYFSLEKPLHRAYYATNQLEFCENILSSDVAYDNSDDTYEKNSILKYNLWMMFSPAQRLFYLIYSRKQENEEDLENRFINPSVTNYFLVKPLLDTGKKFNVFVLSLVDMEFPVGLWSSMVEIGGKFKSLKQLFLHNCTFDERNYAYFILYLQSKTDLEKLSLSDCNLTYDMVMSLSNTLSKQTELWHLSVTGIDAIEGEVPIQELIKAVTSLENISELLFGECPFNVTLVLEAIKDLLGVEGRKSSIRIGLKVSTKLGELQATKDDVNLLLDIAYHAIKDYATLKMFDFDFMSLSEYYSRRIDNKFSFQQAWLHIQCIVLAYNNSFKIAYTDSTISRYRLRTFLWADNMFSRQNKKYITTDRSRIIYGLYIVAWHGFNKDWISRKRVKRMYNKQRGPISYLRDVVTDNKEKEFVKKTKVFWNPQGNWFSDVSPKAVRLKSTVEEQI